MLEHFVELRKYIEHSHDGLSNRLEKVEAGQQKLEGRLEMVEGGLKRLEGRQEGVEGELAGLERKVDAGFDRLARKIDTLTPARRAAPRRRKQ